MMGFALLQVGVREGTPRETRAGLAGVDAAVRSTRWGASVSSFEVLAVASSYNLARGRLAGNAQFARMRPRWETWLRHKARIDALNHPTYNNHKLVEAVAVLEVLRTGLSSKTSGTILSDPRTSRRRAEDLINVFIPYVARRTRRTVNGLDAALVSDPTANPLAYHGLAAGVLARGIALLGARSSPAARATLRHALNASWFLTGPDGALAYYGRSDEEAWALAFTSYAAETVNATASAADAERFRDLSERALRRLRDVHGVGPRGLWIVPALGQDLDGGKRALDGYANAPAFAGLTMVGLGWALESPGAFRARPRPTPPRSALLSVDKGEMAVVRSPSRWYPVRTYPGSVSDVRYDFGVLTLKVRTDGRWHDAMPVRPTPHARIAPSGPNLLRAGMTATPVGRAASLQTDGRLEVRADFVSGDRVLRRGVPIVFKPTACGVAISLPARSNDVFEYSAFFGARPAVDASGAADPHMTVRASTDAATTVSSGLAAATDPSVSRALLKVRPEGPSLRFSLCAR